MPRSFAVLLNGDKELFSIPEFLSKQGINRTNAWIHIHPHDHDYPLWLHELGADPIVIEALTVETSRARFMDVDEGIFLTLNQIGPKIDLEDLLSIRLWVTEKQVITFSARHFPGAEMLLHEIHQGIGPKGTSEFMIHLIRIMSSLIEPDLDHLDHSLDLLETRLDHLKDRAVSRDLSDIRSNAIIIRRLLIPQRDAMIQLHNCRAKWFIKGARRKIREELERLQLFIETLELIKERASIMMDENRIALAQSTNQGMYVFSLVAVLFLPISALTSLFGVNLGGIPGSGSSNGFWIFSLILLGIEGLLIAYFMRRWRLF